MKTLLSIVLFILFFNTTFAQHKTYHGSLIKINFHQSAVDTNNAAAEWESVFANEYSTDQFYEKVFTTNSTTYLIKKTSNSSRSGIPFPSYQTVLINANTNNESILFSGYYPEYGTGIYLSTDAKAISTNKGIILSNNYSLAGYHLSSYQLNNIGNTENGIYVLHVAGKLNSKYLVVVKDMNEEDYKFYLEDFDNNIFPTFSEEIKFQNIPYTFSPAPEKIYQLTDSTSIMSFEWVSELQITKFANTVITKIDSLDIGARYFWAYKSQKLFYINDNYLVSKNFLEAESKFDEPQTKLRVGANTAVDVDENYFATIYSDSLFIYSLAEDSLINKIDISTLYNYSHLLIDPPYVYIHKLDKVTGVEEFAEVPTSFELYQNYPNPFNPETTISYTLQVSGYTTLKVYDVLGREVAALVNEQQLPGKYSVQLNVEQISNLRYSLSSGIYFYTLRVSDSSPGKSGLEFQGTRKMLLLK
ncbi:MAG: T9SS type A sorting domain-containing protein [Ignavibacteriales bacterium]|nr:T9SS type A sorting domain-containing protein [Ignavibacteriales bacterium]